MSTPALQFSLLELAPEYWYRLRQKKEQIRRTNLRPNSHNAYKQAWKVFSNWCAEIGAKNLPTDAETITDYAGWALYERARRYRLGTLDLTLSAIRHYHREAGLADPVTKEVREWMRNAALDLRERKRYKKALTPEQLQRVCSYLLRNDEAINVRDRAMILLQFAAGWRCSEVVGLQFNDIEFTDKGFIVTLGASKADQTGKKGREVGIEYGDHADTCPVRALKAWLAKRGKTPGFLFVEFDGGGGMYLDRGLEGDSITERMKIILPAVGIDAAQYGSHSLRAGMVTAAIEHGASETAIMARTGHSSYETMRLYVRRARAFPPANPLKGVL
jgi:integrase